MKTFSTIPMLTAFEGSVHVHIDSVLFAFPVLAHPDKLQVFDETGRSLVCDLAVFEQSLKEHQGHQLDQLGNVENTTWIHKVYWNDVNQLKNTFRTIYAMGGLVEIDASDILLVVHKGSVYTLFTEEGVFFKPAIKHLGTLCPHHAFNFSSNAAWRKGMSPEAIQQRIYAKGLRYRGYRS